MKKKVMIKTVIKILRILIKFFPDNKFKMNNSSDEEDNVPSPPPWRVKSEQIQVRVKEKLRQIKGQVRSILTLIATLMMVSFLGLSHDGRTKSAFSPPNWNRWKNIPEQTNYVHTKYNQHCQYCVCAQENVGGWDRGS